VNFFYDLVIFAEKPVAALCLTLPNRCRPPSIRLCVLCSRFRLPNVWPYVAVDGNVDTAFSDWRLDFGIQCN